MPYKRISFVKLFVTLLDEDDRFLYKLNERQQLLYVKMLLLAGKTQNKIVKRYDYIKNMINYQGTEDELFSDINSIQANFKKLKFYGDHYYFEKFHELHNYILDKEKKQVFQPPQQVVEEEVVEEKKPTTTIYFAGNEPKNMDKIPSEVGGVSYLVPKKSGFVKPTIAEINDYVKEINAGINPEHFWDFYESKGWKIGKEGMKDWKAAVRTWRTNNGQGNNASVRSFRTAFKSGDNTAGTVNTSKYDEVGIR